MKVAAGTLTYLPCRLEKRAEDIGWLFRGERGALFDHREGVEIYSMSGQSWAFATMVGRRLEYVTGTYCLLPVSFSTDIFLRLMFNVSLTVGSGEGASQPPLIILIDLFRFRRFPRTVSEELHRSNTGDLKCRITACCTRG